ncbi:MAG: hypothetical protein D6715_14055 [Calditrichaeota bacterium]|nr:MAG: hypothetical protein D6715_14055 [Calditrichota bacterium]
MSTASKDARGRFPSFQLRSPSGQIISETWLQQRPLTLVLFYKKDCPTSRLVNTLLSDLWRAHSLPAELILLVSQDREEKTAQTVTEWELPFPVACDAPAYSLSKILDFEAVPTGYLVSRNLSIQHWFTGFVRQEFQEVLEALLKANGIDAPVELNARSDLPVFSPG